jgi:hypothetical protein
VGGKVEVQAIPVVVLGREETNYYFVKSIITAVNYSKNDKIIKKIPVTIFTFAVFMAGSPSIKHSNSE